MSDISDSPEAGPSGTYTQTQITKKKSRKSVKDVFATVDMREKQRLGQGLRDLQSKTDDDRANVSSLKYEHFQSILEKQDEIFNEVQDTDTGAMDARLLADHSKLFLTWTKEKHQAANSFDTDEFLEGIKKQLGLGTFRLNVSDDSDDEEDQLMDDDNPTARSRKRRRGDDNHRGGLLGDWEKIGWMAAKMYRRVPGVEFLYGPLTIEHKKKTMAARQKKAVLAPPEKPIEIQNNHDPEKAEKELQAWVKRIKTILRKTDPTASGYNFFRFVVNPDSFAQTVENIFYVSFLIRDGHVGIEVGDDGEIIIRTMIEHGQPVVGDGKKNQGVMEFDMEAWQLAIDTFNITESVIPHREVNAAAPTDP